MKTYGFGIIGCGMISGYHAAAIAEIPQAKLTVCADPQVGSRKKLAEKFGCDEVSDYADLVKRKDVDIVCICTPSGAHLEPGLAAAKAGKHVIVEKPLEVTLERTDALIQACTDNGVRLGAIFPSRFAEAARVVKKAIDAGRFGRVTVGDCYNKWWRSQQYYDSGGWRGTMALDGGGACMNQGIHAIDLIQWFMGPVESVMAFSGCLIHERIEVEDTAVAALRYRSGAMGVIECTTSVYPGLSRRLEIHGDRGTAVLEDSTITKWEFAEEQPQDAEIRMNFGPGTSTVRTGAADPRAMTHDNHREQLKDFIEAIDAGRPAQVEGREGRKAIEIILAIYESARTGKAVALPLRKG